MATLVGFRGCRCCHLRQTSKAKLSSCSLGFGTSRYFPAGDLVLSLERTFERWPLFSHLPFPAPVAARKLSATLALTSDSRKSWSMRLKCSVRRDTKPLPCATFRAPAACHSPGCTITSDPKKNCSISFRSTASPQLSSSYESG